jgi:DNA methylase
MRQINRGKQVKTVWTIAAPGGDEKSHGKHPTQKPVALVERCLLASTNEGDLVLDPFIGGGYDSDCSDSQCEALRRHRSGGGSYRVIGG